MRFFLNSALFITACVILAASSEAQSCHSAWQIKAKGGVAPSFYTQRKQPWLNIPFAGRLLRQRGKKAEFCDQFKTPWLAGGEIGYFMSRSTEFFLDADYTRAKGKAFHYTASTSLGSNNLTEKYDDLKQTSVYLGLRRYLGCLPCGWSGYLGAKAGFQHRNAVHQYITVAGIGNVGKRPYYANVNTVAAGIQLGLSYSFCECWSASLQVEGLYAGPMRNAVYRNNPPVGGFLANVVIGETGAILSIPCTIGITGSW